MTADSGVSLAFLGMGIMGASMAANLSKAGFSVKVWNRSPGKPGLTKALSAGCRGAESIKDCVAGAPVIFSCLGDVDDVKAVLAEAGGVVDFAPEGALVVDFSTIGPRAAREISDALAKSPARLRFLDAPVTGGDIGAANGTLTIMLGGERADFDEALPYLSKMGKVIEYCGPAGSGQALKLANQVLCAVNMLAVSEALSLAERFEIEPSLVVDVLKEGAGGSWALANLGARIIKDDLAPGFMLKHMIKDLRLIHDNADGASLNLPAMEMAESMFKELVEADGKAAEAFGTQAMIEVYRR
ncbi:NAD-binding protein [bacterium]|nr:NAD-binding protein [bacterium]